MKASRLINKNDLQKKYIKTVYGTYAWAREFAPKKHSTTVKLRNTLVGENMRPGLPNFDLELQIDCSIERFQCQLWGNRESL